MKSLILALALTLTSLAAHATPTDEIKAKAISVVKFMITDRGTALGRANTEMTKHNDVEGQMALVDDKAAEFGRTNAMILSQMGSRTESSSTLLVRVPYSNGTGLMWENRSITVLVKVNLAYDEQNDLTSYQTLVDDRSIQIHKED